MEETLLLAVWYWGEGALWNRVMEAFLFNDRFRSKKQKKIQSSAIF